MLLVIRNSLSGRKSQNVSCPSLHKVFSWFAPSSLALVLLFLTASALPGAVQADKVLGVPLPFTTARSRTASTVASSYHANFLVSPQQRAHKKYNNISTSNMKDQCLEQAACLADQMRGGHIEHASNVMDTPYGLPLNVWKVLFQALLTGINVACWLIPLRSKQVVDNPLALSLANAFSGGVFLALAFGHLIPECLHGFPSDWNETAPFYLVLLGYLVIFFVEKVAFDAHDILHEMQAGGTGHSHSHSHSHGAERKGAQSNGSTTTTTTSTGRSALILLGALGVHSILEMMALGLADTFRDGALLTASIALHQPAESIALLVAFLKSGLSHQEILTYLSIFSCMGPIGVALGMAVNEYAAPVVDAAMLAVVAGTFVYVGATEVIPEEWEDSKHKWKKFAALMTGIASIAAITQYTMSLGGHDHSHAH